MHWQELTWAKVAGLKGGKREDTLLFNQTAWKPRSTLNSTPTHQVNDTTDDSNWSISLDYTGWAPAEIGKTRTAQSLTSD